MSKRNRTRIVTRLAAGMLAAIMLLAASAPAWGAELTRLQVLVNKQHTLSEYFVPPDLVYLDDYMSAGENVMMDRNAAIAMGRMVQAAAKEGVTGFYGQSGYRSYSLQYTLYQNKISQYRNWGYSYQNAVALAGQEVAPPGASEHQTGMALDISTYETGYTLEEDFGSTKVGKWLAANCWKYGFILRYPQNKTNITGYIYEPWHFRYVGAPHAEYMHKNGLTLEEYYDLVKRSNPLEFRTANGYTYNVYYSATNISSQIPGVVVGLSAADPAGRGFLITARPPLYDLDGHWSEAEVRSLAGYGVVKGYTDGTFRPSNTINRAELVAMVGRTWDLLFFENRYLDPPSGPSVEFADVSPSDYYFNSLMKMYEAGLVASSLVETGENGQLYFNSKAPVLRYQAAESLAPLFRALPEVTGSAELLDMYNQSPELREAVQVLVDYGVVKGDNRGNFNPNQRITRAEIASMLDRVIKYYLDEQ